MLLSPFSREQSSDYLTWRFTEAAYDGRTPFTEHQIDIIHKTSGGYPGRLDFAANEQLMLMTVGGKPTPGIPSKHLWLAGGLAFVLGLVLWLWSPGEHLEVDKKTVELEMPSAKDSKALSNAEDSESRELVASTPGTEETDPIETLAETSDIGDSKTEKVALPLSRTVEPVANPPPKEPEPVANPSRTVRPEPAIAKTDPVPVREPEPQFRSDPKPEPQPEPRPEPQPQRTVRVADTSGVHNAAWLLAQDDGAYTIQLVGLSAADRARDYLSQQDQPERFALFRTRSGDRVIHVVTYGVYSNLAAAESAVARLPSTVGTINPWVRPIRSVKSAIGTTTQGN